MKTLTQILETAAQVRAEQQENENTAERVGGVLCDLTDFLQNKTALTGVNVRTNANGVSIEVRAQTGDGQEASTVLVFPEATETQAGIITSELLRTLRAGINSNSDTIQNLDTVLQDCVSKISAAQASIKENSNNIKDLLAASKLHDTRLANHGEAIENNQELLREHRTDIADAKAAISAAQESIRGNANDISAAKAAISAAQASIQENRERIGTLHTASEVHDTRLASHGKAIEDAQALLREHRTDISAAKAAISAAQESIRGNANDISAAKAAISAAQASILENRERIGTLHTASEIHDIRLGNHGTAIEDAQKTIRKHTEDIEGVKTKLDEYPSQFILDLGTVSSQEEGESRAASSDVAGNRNISFIRFQVNGVSALKTTLILQWPNGINETGQIKFIDKAQWRRNVSGATGVSGATTTATQWERTAPHYIGYDAARRMIQLKDYTQTVSREVELPLATSTQHGLMSEVDKEKIDNYPNNPLKIPLATLSKPGLMGATDCRNLAETQSLASENNRRISALESNSTGQEQRIGVLESIHAPSDYVEMTISNEQTQRNVLFYKIEWIDDLEIDGRPINTEGLSGKFYRSLSVGEHKVRFRVSEENRTQRGLLGWADDESAGYLSHVTRIVIPEGWTELPSNCFERRVHLEEVVLPSTLRIVGGNCFQSLPALRELIIPQSVTTINWSAINDCASLKSIRMGGSESMPLSLASEAIRNCPALTCVEFLPCRLTFKGSTSPFQNLPQLSALICHLTEEPTFEPASPFGSIGSSASNKKLYRPAGIAFYASGYWRTQLCNSLGFTPADI